MFNVGDRVECIVDHPDDNKLLLAGYFGTVCVLDSGPHCVGVCWDEEIGGHSCWGACEYGHGWWMRPSEIELYQECDDEPFSFDEQEFKALLGMNM